MAPGRRKGAGKAAAAAAARRQWKVGDLVLAKVKGFPAWPATVSEPEKWGYTSDWKKVLVYFFGTQQIAFCNHADVEPFTEEKKQSLLVKRQGRGADFVRAVQEIIDSYEKSKEQVQPDAINSSNGATQITGCNPVDSSPKNILIDEAEVPTETLEDSVKQVLKSVRDRREASLPTEDSVKQVDSLHEKESLQEKPTESVLVADSPLLATYSSRKRSGGSRQQTCVAQRRSVPVRRSRSSSRAESSQFHNFAVATNDGGKVCEKIVDNGGRDGSLRRNKRIRKSPNTLDCNDRNSPALASDVSADNNGSEIVTVEYDFCSLNESSTLDFGSNLESSETVECLVGDLELRKEHLKIKAGMKKKRKPNRKRGMTGETDHIDTLDRGGNDTGQNSHHIFEKATERDSKEDGDEHLPLVKRARVRMGEPSSMEEPSSLPQVENKIPNEVTASSVGQNSSALTCGIDANRNSFLVKGTTNKTSSSTVGTQYSGNQPQFWKVMKNQILGCSTDGEAALPPSKRLQRALEAMSAKAAEEGRGCIEASTMNTSINGCCSSPRSRCLDMAVECRDGNGSGLENLDCSTKSSIQIGASGFSTSSNPISSEGTSSSVGGDIFYKHNQSFEKEENEFDKDSAAEATNIVEGINHIGSSADTNAVQMVRNIVSPESLLPNTVSGEVNPAPNQVLFDKLLLSRDEDGRKELELGNCRTENSDIEFSAGISENNEFNRDIVQGIGENNEVLPGDDAKLHQNSSDGAGCEKSQVDDSCQVNGSYETVSDRVEFKEEPKGTSCENIESLKSQVDDSCQVNGLYEAVSDRVEFKEERRGTSSASVSSDDRSSDKIPHPTDVIDFPAHVSSPSTITCHIPTSESANFPKFNGCSSPNVRLDQDKSFITPVVDEGKSESVTQKTKLFSKWNNYAEAHAALSSFEAILGTLTGKKESIGRATRMAIECGKLGVAAKVVEILTRYLESESSLNKRVDLFFLVDSITQCSRNMKGDVGGKYLSSIQMLLPRLLSAAAPPGSAGQENRRQCLKVLRVWLDRRIIPEAVVRQHIRELDLHGGAFPSGVYSRRSSRTERSLDDPVREMEGMLVDEYGSNSSFQLPGFCMPRMRKDEDDGSDSDGGTFEAVTPEHKPDTPEEQETTQVGEKHRHILEDVDGELEMEDVAPSCDVEINATNNVASEGSLQSSHDGSDQPVPPPFGPPPPPPLPSSPPPSPPSLPPPCAMSNSYSASVDSNTYTGTNNIQDSSRHPGSQHPVAGNYHAPEFRDRQMHMPMLDSGNSFGCYANGPVNNVHLNDSAGFHGKHYPLRPPHPAPSDQFSYVHADPNSRREVPPPSFPNRYDGMHNNMGPGNFYNNHDRMRPGPYENGDHWRHHPPPFPGPQYLDEGRTCYPHVPYTGPSHEPPRFQNPGWDLPPQAANHINPMPMRHPPEGPNFWRPR